jgi:hypothetical protein
MAIARAGGANGLRMTRSAFALLIKFSDMLEEFVQLIDHVEVYKDMMGPEESKNMNSIIKQLKEEMPQFPQIMKKWDQASSMRKFIQDYKSQLIEKFESEVEKEVLKKKMDE